MVNSADLVKGQKIKVQLSKVNDRLPKNLLDKITTNPVGHWNGGYKMVDGNSFGLVIELFDGTQIWFFEEELIEVDE